jgi:hypothetical protein
VQLNKWDKISQFIDGQYTSAPESAWRILQFHIHEQHPSITRLQVHLVTFDPDEDPQDVLERAANECTTLTAFFAANADQGALGIEARKFTYQEFPQHFAWKPLKKMWDIRQRGFALGHMYYVGPTGGERFYLLAVVALLVVARPF